LRVSRICEALLRKRPRATGVCAAHAGNAFWAAAVAAANSAASDNGYRATVSRVSAGLVVVKVAPDAAGTQFPPMKLA